MQPFLIIVLIIVIYGLHLLQKSLPRLYREGEKGLVSAVATFMLAAPLLLWLGWLYMQQRPTIWVAFPWLLLALLWIGAGYLVEAYRKSRERGVRRLGRNASPEVMSRIKLILLGGGLIWFFGTFIGVADESLDMILLFTSFSLLSAGLGSLWKYRKF